MSSTTTYQEITPTRLYIKQHSITGLKYFGKTTQEDPYKYPGSGSYWTRHYKKHGKEHIKTLWVSDFYYDTSIIDIALHFSEESKIDSSPKIWANLKPENGLDGFTSEQVAKNNKICVENKTHNFLNRDNAVMWNNQRIAAGTHNFLDISLCRAAGKIGGKISSEKRISNGTHNFLGTGDKKRNLALRPLYLEIKLLYKTLDIKMPRNTYMRSSEYLEDIKNKLSVLF